jgi:hypothetical protein
VPTLSPLPARRVNLAYRESHTIHGTWTSPPRRLPDRAAAEQLQDAITVLAGPDARARRTWTIGACTCRAAS